MRINMSETSDYDDDFDARDALNDLIEDLPSRQPSQLQLVYELQFFLDISYKLKPPRHHHNRINLEQNLTCQIVAL